MDLAVVEMKSLPPCALVTRRLVLTVRLASRRSLSQTSGGVKTWIFCQMHPQLRHLRAHGSILQTLGRPHVLPRSANLQGRQVCSAVRCHASGCHCLRQEWHHQCQHHWRRSRHRCQCQSSPLLQVASENRKALRSPSLDVPTVHPTSGQRRCQCQQTARKQH